MESLELTIPQNSFPTTPSPDVGLNARLKRFTINVAADWWRARGITPYALQRSLIVRQQC